MANESPPKRFQPVRRWLRAYADAYLLVVTALVLNLPLLLLVLARHLDGVPLASMTGVYASLVFLGYYGLILFVLVTLVFVATSFARRVAITMAAMLLTGTLYFFVLNSIVHGIFRFHIDAFWIEYLFTNFDGIGIPPSMVLTAAALLLGVIAVQWGAFHLAKRIRHRVRLVGVFVLAAVAALGVSQTIHIVAYYKNDNRITGITPQLPFYFPMRSHKHAVQYGHLLPLPPAANGGAHGSTSIRYPLAHAPLTLPADKKPMNVLMIVLESWRYDMIDAEISPHMHAFAESGLNFTRHFSSGNSTPSGVFSLFYGIHPTYWAAVKANSKTIDNPLFIDALRDNEYAFGIFADSHFERHKIKDTVFNGIHVHETFEGATTDQRDDDMTNDLIAFIEEQSRKKQPFFGFAFYKSTHYSYYYPEDSARFLPSGKLNIALMNSERNPTLYVNDYRNAIHYVDGLVGRLLQRVEELDLRDDTVIIITSDHGEEFNDNGENYWGHTSNFTQYQTQVPLVLSVPGAAPRRVTEVTSHVDIPTTLLQEVFGYKPDVRTYSNGLNLLGKLDTERPIVASSYVNHAFIMDDNVYAVYPMYVQRYRLSDITAKADPLRADLMKRAIEETSRFYVTPDAGEERIRAASVGGR